MEQKKYHSIVRLGHRSTEGVLKEGDNIVVQEKLDGANASFKVDENGNLRVYSRNKELDEENNLGGFYQWAKESINPNELVNSMVFFGEWLNPHKIKYPKYVKQFFLYDLYDIANEQYLGFHMVEKEAKRLGLNLVPLFYKGKYKSFEHLESFVGRTDVGGMLNDKEAGEGIVVKNPAFTNRFGEQLFVKLVSDEFREVQKQKAPKDPSKVTAEQIFINQVINEARVEKMLHKKIDDNVIDKHWGIEDMGVILKSMSNDILEDAIKEESELLPKEYEDKKLKKSLGKTLPQIIKKIIDKSK